MRALCPSCGVHHEVVRMLEDGVRDEAKDVYQVAPLEGCTRTWLSQSELLDARARFNLDAIVQDEDDDV